MAYRIRKASLDDLTDILRLIQRKAVFDGCPERVAATREKLEKTLFAARPMAYILLVETDSADDLPVGFASYHFTFSTFLAQPSIWLDDIFVESAHRNRGIGTQLIEQLCQTASDRDCGRIDWTVDVNNAAGIRFYQRISARLKKEVYLCRMTSEAIAQASASGFVK